MISYGSTVVVVVAVVRLAASDVASRTRSDCSVCMASVWDRECQSGQPQSPWSQSSRRRPGRLPKFSLDGLSDFSLSDFSLSDFSLSDFSPTVFQVLAATRDVMSRSAAEPFRKSSCQSGHWKASSPDCWSRPKNSRSIFWTITLSLLLNCVSAAFSVQHALLPVHWLDTEHTCSSDNALHRAPLAESDLSVDLRLSGDHRTSSANLPSSIILSGHQLSERQLRRTASRTGRRGPWSAGS
eukprot:647644-Hanusia_phi.AAC.1